MDGSAAVAFAMLAGVLGHAHAHADVNVADVNIKVSVSPPAAIAAPPRVVSIEGSRVFYAPASSYNLFIYDGRYYSFHNGVWFVAAGAGSRWTFVASTAVPPAVLAVPVSYYRIPPGHAKKVMKTHARGDARGCPPGLAQQGRC
jgi:hypothetical protein